MGHLSEAMAAARGEQPESLLLCRVSRVLRAGTTVTGVEVLLPSGERQEAAWCGAFAAAPPAATKSGALVLVVLVKQVPVVVDVVQMGDRAWGT